MCYLSIQDATNMQHDFVFFVAAETKKLCFAKIFDFWKLAFYRGRLKLNYFLLQIVAMSLSFPVFVCLTSPSRQVALNF